MSNMVVTQITAINKSRYRVVLDETTAFVLYKGELNRYHIHEGAELSEDIYRIILHETLPRRARLRCMNLLKSRDYTRKQLEDKLKQGGYPAEIIADAISYVESYGYINDERYVKDYIEYNMPRKSRLRIENDLQKKGISKELICRVFDEFKENGIEADEAGMIEKLLEKKRFCVQSATDDEKRRMYGFLYRKGFHTDVINRVLCN